MEHFELPKPTEARSVAGLADAALRLQDLFDLQRSPHAHIFSALDAANIKDLSERKRLFGEIKKELARRSAPFSVRKDVIEDARRQEISHPLDEE